MAEKYHQNMARFKGFGGFGTDLRTETERPPPFLRLNCVFDYSASDGYCIDP